MMKEKEQSRDSEALSHICKLFKMWYNEYRELLFTRNPYSIKDDDSECIERGIVLPRYYYKQILGLFCQESNDALGNKNDSITAFVMMMHYNEMCSCLENLIVESFGEMKKIEYRFKHVVIRVTGYDDLIVGAKLMVEGVGINSYINPSVMFNFYKFLGRIFVSDLTVENTPQCDIVFDRRMIEHKDENGDIILDECIPMFSHCNINDMLVTAGMKDILITVIPTSDKKGRPKYLPAINVDCEGERYSGLGITNIQFSSYGNAFEFNLALLMSGSIDINEMRMDMKAKHVEKCMASMGFNKNNLAN